MGTTTDYGFNLPSGSDNVLINILNSNFSNTENLLSERTKITSGSYIGSGDGNRSIDIGSYYTDKNPLIFIFPSMDVFSDDIEKYNEILVIVNRNILVLSTEKKATDPEVYLINTITLTEGDIAITPEFYNYDFTGSILTVGLNTNAEPAGWGMYGNAPNVKYNWVAIG